MELKQWKTNKRKMRKWWRKQEKIGGKGCNI